MKKIQEITTKQFPYSDSEAFNNNFLLDPVQLVVQLSNFTGVLNSFNNIVCTK